MVKRKRVTIKTIASEAGVSIATVSSILNNKKGFVVRENTRNKIFKTVERLGYKPDYIARSLKSQKTNTIGFIVPLLSTGVTLSDIEILEALTREKNYHLFIGYSKGFLKEEEDLLEEFYSRRVDGVILVPSGLKLLNRTLLKLSEEKFPVVSITKPYRVKIPYVSTDYKKGGYMATEYLIKTGYKRIGFLGGDLGFQTIRERLNGFKKALNDYGLGVDESLIFQIPKEKESDNRYISNLCSDITGQKIDAVFSSSDHLAIFLIKAALEKGKRIPEDLSIIGFNDSELSILSPIPVTTIRQPVKDLTETAFKILLEMIEGEKLNQERVIFKPELIVRESTKTIL
jgi:LacI family transcriptional regulator